MLSDRDLHGLSLPPRTLCMTYDDGPEDRPTSLVAKRLRASGRFPDYVGPVKWDIVAEDWECWRRGESVQQCAERHFEQIERVGRGIVLLHDSCDNEALRSRNQTGSMTMLLVPWLKARGYRFVSLGAIPEVRAAVEAAQRDGAAARRGETALHTR